MEFTKPLPSLGLNRFRGGNHHDSTHLTLLAENSEGYANICRILTAGHTRIPQGLPHPWETLAQHSKSLIVLWLPPLQCESSCPAPQFGSGQGRAAASA